MGKRIFAVRYNVCRAFFIGHTAKPLFAVRFPYGARQTFTHGFYYVCRAFVGRRTANICVCRAS
jgi:hypothetical protein